MFREVSDVVLLVYMFVELCEFILKISVVILINCRISN